MIIEKRYVPGRIRNRSEDDDELDLRRSTTNSGKTKPAKLKNDDTWQLSPLEVFHFLLAKKLLLLFVTILRLILQLLAKMKEFFSFVIRPPRQRKDPHTPFSLLEITWAAQTSISLLSFQQRKPS